MGRLRGLETIQSIIHRHSGAVESSGPTWQNGKSGMIMSGRSNRPPGGELLLPRVRCLQRRTLGPVLAAGGQIDHEVIRVGEAVNHREVHLLLPRARDG